MSLARQISIPGTGAEIQVITGDPEAAWVGETEEKPVDEATLDTKTLKPYKLAVIELFSDEFRRDLPGLYGELARRLPGAIAKKFDSTVFSSTAPGGNFDTLGGASAVALAPHASDVKKGTYAGLVQAVGDVANVGGNLDGWALSSQARALLLGQVDSTGRPLLIDTIQDGGPVQRILGAPVANSQGTFASGSPATIGFAGDWNSAVWGVVSGVSVDVTDQASIAAGVTTVGAGEHAVDIPNQINLWQRNMFALRCEVEIGFRVRNVNRFVKLTNGTRS